MRRQPWKKSGNRAKNGKPGKNSLRIESLENRRLLAADLVSLLPLDGATGVGVNDNLVLTFSADVKAGPGAGRLLIMNAADDSLVEAVDVSDAARVSFAGATVTVDPLKALPADAKLYISIDPGAIRDTATTKSDGVLFSENFETSKLLDSELDNPGIDNYTLVMTGTLDVQTAGDYRFGGRAGDGSWLAIDLNGDGNADINDAADVVLFDDTTHGQENKFAENAITLAKGQYKFEYGYFDAKDSSAGEFFYAPDPAGDITAFSYAKFAIVGDPSKGIGLTADKVKATTYKAAEGVEVLDIATALSLRDGNDLAAGFPVSATFETADVWDSGNGQGRYGVGNPNLLPGVVVPPDATPGDSNPDMPPGWSEETSKPQQQPAYSGWAQLDKEFWIAEQGNQDRDVWELGQGTVAVMDPDAFDDYSPIDDGVEPEHDLEAYMTLPAIDLTDVTAGTMKLDFDSSYRPEALRTNDEHPDWLGQTALVDVSFDGGTSWENVMLQNQETAGGTGSLQNANEHLTLNVPNPSGGSMLVRFAIVNATNDWWWAVDNIVITGEAVGDLYDGIANNRETWNFQTAASPGGLPGDFNADNKVDLTDFGILKDNFGTGTSLAQGDTNGDAKVDLTDFGILKDNFGKAGAAPAVLQATDYVFAVALAEAAKESTDDGDADPFADDSL